jgi:class 3 adenylate cyclase
VVDLVEHPRARDAGMLVRAGLGYGRRPDWPAVPQDPLTLKGFDSPVAAYDLHLSR